MCRRRLLEDQRWSARSPGGTEKVFGIKRRAACILFGLSALAAVQPIEALAQPRNMEPVPARRNGEGAGPFPKIVIRGATLIDGSGAPPRGPVDIVIQGNRIAEIRSAGTPGLPLRPDREPRDAAREIEAAGMYVLPGFVDTHGHNGDPARRRTRATDTNCGSRTA
jgi:hypothetical protein